MVYILIGFYQPVLKKNFIQTNIKIKKKSCFAIEVVNYVYTVNQIGLSLATTRGQTFWFCIWFLLSLPFATCISIIHFTIWLLSMITRSIYVKSAEISTITKAKYTDTQKKRNTREEKKLKCGDKKEMQWVQSQVVLKYVEFNNT